MVVLVVVVHTTGPSPSSWFFFLFFLNVKNKGQLVAWVRGVNDAGEREFRVFYSTINLCDTPKHDN